VKARREELEKGLIGLNIEMKKQREDFTNQFKIPMKEIEELK